MINKSSVPGVLSKGDRIVSAVESLMTGDNNQQILENLKMYHDAGRGSRIAIFHENIEESEKKMAVSALVYNKMKDLVEKTAETKKEHSFIVFGWVQDDNYLFNGIGSDVEIGDDFKKYFYDKNPDLKTGDSAADFNLLLGYYRQAIDSHIDRMKASGAKPLISLGHTHPNVSEAYGDYSLPDLVGFSSQEEAIRGRRDEGEFEYCHIVLPEDGDVDCMAFDKDRNRFEKITKVISVGQSEEEELPAYTFKSSKSLSAASYVKERNESEEDELYDSCVEEVIRRHQWDNMEK
ncbi:hypothetical protein J5491_02925 [Candidatus Saccharibacteria bacterium]|nr:hypothetical protein [Candidatus Saccharibacteria bacterium]